MGYFLWFILGYGILPTPLTKPNKWPSTTPPQNPGRSSQAFIIAPVIFLFE